MNRREALSSVALLLGGSIIGSEMFLLSGCKSSPEKVNELFTVDDVTLLDEIAETIIPQTDTPGAKAAKTGAFMALMVNDCYTKDEQKIFLDGLKDINKLSQAKYQKDFLEMDKDQRKSMLILLDKEQKEARKKDESHYFRMMKELALFGYFTSEQGATQELSYIEVPGRYDGCVPYKKGDPAYL